MVPGPMHGRTMVRFAAIFREEAYKRRREKKPDSKGESTRIANERSVEATSWRQMNRWA